MKRLKVRDFGTKVQGVTLRADKREPEPETFRVAIPGGDVDVVRTSDGSFWVHVRVDRLPHVHVGGLPGEVRGTIVDARLDIAGKHTTECDAGDFGHEDLYHLAVRVKASGS